MSHLTDKHGTGGCFEREHSPDHFRKILPAIFCMGKWWHQHKIMECSYSYMPHLNDSSGKLNITVQFRTLIVIFTSQGMVQLLINAIIVVMCANQRSPTIFKTRLGLVVIERDAEQCFIGWYATASVESVEWWIWKWLERRWIPESIIPLHTTIMTHENSNKHCYPSKYAYNAYIND